MRILQVSTSETGGGAESIAWQLCHGYRKLGHESWLAVGRKQTHDSHVWQIPHDEFRSHWARGWLAFSRSLQSFVGSTPTADRAYRLCTMAIGQPSRLFDRLKGIEDFAFPGTLRLTDPLPNHPDIIHCHNLHGGWLSEGGYFDLRALPQLTARHPVAVTLHDAWLLSGHCAHSFDCERWKIGCGSCPDLTIYPSVRRDATANNWARKQRIFSNSRLYIATPARWLMGKVEQSMLCSAMVESRVIPNGVDLTVFHPGNQNMARKEIGIAQDKKVVLCAAHGVQGNVWKDYATMRAAILEVGRRMPSEHVLFVALGEEGPTEQVGPVEIRFIPFTKNSHTVARYYQAADVYLHAARADTFPNTILEALACGIPVVATAVGGIPEQVDDSKTGFLVPSGDVKTMADSLLRVLSDGVVRKRLSQEAAHIAETRFDLRRQVAAYLNWFEEIVEAWERQPGNAPGRSSMLVGVGKTVSM
jgi:glycosyltransferase involved in cell wall biosynthesis